ncbi:MAG: hypothetical protein ACRDTF_17325 [Pseudonocardiaceae bacterium]
MTSTIEVPEIVALCRDDETPVAGWAMVLPQTKKVVAYVLDHTSIGIGLPEIYSSPEDADRIFGYARLYPVPNWPTSAEAPPSRCCPTCNCAVVAELTARG